MTDIDKRNADRRTDQAEPIAEENKETRDERSEEERRSRGNRAEN